MTSHVRECLKQIDENSWLIDDKLLLRRSRSLEAADTLWSDEEGWHFSIMNAPALPPIASPLSSDSFPRLVYDVGDASVVFSIGDALLRVKDRHPFQGVTPEPVTLRWLADRKLSFPVPRTLHYTENANRIYFIVSRVPGKTIDEAWRDLTDEQKEHCVTRVAQICQELAVWTSNTISGVDGNMLFDPWLDMGAETIDLSPENLLRNCQQLQMSTSTLVFNHNDLGPTNVMVDVENDCNVGVVDWEMAGFVPFAWVRTKLAACYAMDFCWRDLNVDDPSMREWRDRLAGALQRYNVPQVAEEYRSWLEERGWRRTARKASQPENMVC